MKIIVQDEWYSIESCQKELTKLYIFGDNSLRVGKGGQAAIRNLQNSVGIATKNAPGMSDEDFFSDQFNEFNIIISDIHHIHNIFMKPELSHCSLVFPKDGLGTGLAQLPQRAPIINNLLADLLRVKFGVGTNNDGTLFVIT